MADRLVIFKHKKIAKKIYDPEQFPLAAEIVLRGTKAVDESQKEKKRGVPSVRINGLKAGERTISIEACRGEIVLVSREAAPIDSSVGSVSAVLRLRFEFIIDGKSSVPYDGRFSQKTGLE